MKKAVVTTLINTLVYTSLSAQIPLVPDLHDLEPVWSRISVDTNYYKFGEDEFTDEYSNIETAHTIIDGDYLYYLDQTRTKNPYGGRGGCLVHKVNMTSGQDIWSYHNNENTGNINREDYLNGAMVINSDGDIDLIGRLDIDPIDTLSTEFFWFANPIRRTIASETGVELAQQSGSDTSKNVYQLAGITSTSYQYYQDEVIAATSDRVVIDDTVNNVVHLRTTNTDYNIDSIPTLTLAHSSDQTSLSGQMIYIPRISNPTDGVMSITFGLTDAQGLAARPIELEHQLVDVSSPRTPQLISKHTIVPPYDTMADNSSQLICLALDNQVYLSQRIVQVDSIGDVERDYFWVAWYDQEGEEEAYDGYVNPSDKTYNSLYPITIHDGYTYLIGRFTEPNEVGNDILRIKSGSSEVEHLNTISVRNSAITRLLVTTLDILEDGDLLASVRFSVPGTRIGRDYNYMYRFDGVDFGTEVVSTTGVLPALTSIKVYPNPTDGLLYLDHGLGDGHLHILNHLGQVVYNGSLPAPDESIDMSELAPGLYTAQLAGNEHRPQTVRFIKL